MKVCSVCVRVHVCACGRDGETLSSTLVPLRLHWGGGGDLGFI